MIGLFAFRTVRVYVGYDIIGKPICEVISRRRCGPAAVVDKPRHLNTPRLIAEHDKARVFLR
jgi:hypothetical protein